MTYPQVPQVLVAWNGENRNGQIRREIASSRGGFLGLRTEEPTVNGLIMPPGVVS